jgi:hypothetical protein
VCVCVCVGGGGSHQIYSKILKKVNHKIMCDVLVMWSVSGGGTGRKLCVYKKLNVSCITY